MTDSEEQKQPPMLTNYHWERVTDDLLALYEEGEGPVSIGDDGIVATIIKVPWQFGKSKTKVTYRANGPLVDPPREFDTEEEAISLVEGIIRAIGNMVDGS